MKSKKCKYCQSDIDSKAKLCPNCKKDQRNWFLKHPIISFILLMIILSLFTVDDPNTNKSNNNSTQTTENTTTNTPKEEIKVPMKINVFDLGKSFDDNQIAAEKEWNGKYVEFSAQISNITEGGISFYNISSKEFSMASLRCNVKDEEQLLKVKNGQTITVRGVVQGQSLGIIKVEECEVIN